MDKDNIIEFPTPKVKLTQEEYEEFKTFISKMEKSNSISEMFYYYDLANKLVKKAKQRKNKN